MAILAGLMVSVQTLRHAPQRRDGRRLRPQLRRGDPDRTWTATATSRAATAASTYAGVDACPTCPPATRKSVTAVQSWNGSAWGACTADGIQRLDLKVTTTGDAAHQADETLTVILRQPCNGSAATAGADPCS